MNTYSVSNSLQHVLTKLLLFLTIALLEISKVRRVKGHAQGDTYLCISLYPRHLLKYLTL